MIDLTDLLADTSTSVAVVGATDNPDKYGYVIYRDMKRKGYPVFAVNPNRETVDGDPAFSSLSELPEAPDIVNLVVPASVGLRVVEEADRLDYRQVWLQPGAESPELIARIQELDLDYLADTCIMVRSRIALARAGR